MTYIGPAPPEAAAAPSCHTAPAAAAHSNQGLTAGRRSRDSPNQGLTAGRRSRGAPNQGSTAGRSSGDRA
eukprot:8293792-Pyramimonas_sp.AAC.1